MEQAERVEEGQDSVTSVLSLDLKPVTSDDRIYGPMDAAVTLLEYGEFECPDCGRAHFHLKALRDRLDELDARFVFRHLARDEVHPFSVRAAVTAEAAGAQGRFWDMHDHLFEHQHSLEYEDLKSHAIEVGLDLERFLTDVREPRLIEAVTRQGADAIRNGVTETPTLFINGHRFEGRFDLDELIAAIGREAGRVSEEA